MEPLALNFYKFLYFWLKIFYRNDTIFIIGISVILFLGLFLNYLFHTPMANFVFIFTAIFALVVITGMISLKYIYRILWGALLKQLIKFEFNSLYNIDRDRLLEEWLLRSNFEIILSKEALINFAYGYYKPEYLRSNSDFFIKILSEDLLSAKNRAHLVDQYFSIFTDSNLNYEPHREQVFYEVLLINHPFEFKNGCERFFGLFQSNKVRQKMYEKGWHHRFMRSLIGEEYYLFNPPFSFLFVPETDFNEWFHSSFGKKPYLKKIIIDRMIDRDKKWVKWSYFKYLQVHQVFNFNHDILVTELNSSLDKFEPSPFQCLQLGLPVIEIKELERSLNYLKKYYGDYRLISLLKKVKESAELLKLLKIVEICLSHGHNPNLIKKCREWKQLINSAEEEQKKAQQRDFPLDQFRIYDWEGKSILNYIIWVPRGNFKLIRGGTEMHNCVGNGEHARHIVNKDSFIFFLQKGKKTQVCIDVNPETWEIRSIKGLTNNDVPAGVKEAVQEFINLNK